MIIHRAIRDIQRCRKKYGKAWEEYERQVPYLFIPVSLVVPRLHELSTNQPLVCILITHEELTPSASDYLKQGSELVKAFCVDSEQMLVTSRQWTSYPSSVDLGFQ